MAARTGMPLSVGEPQQKRVVSNSSSNRRKTINGKEENNSIVQGTPTAAKAWQQHGRQHLQKQLKVPGRLQQHTVKWQQCKIKLEH
jgi:hypothetical protein